MPNGGTPRSTEKRGDFPLHSQPKRRFNRQLKLESGTNTRYAVCRISKLDRIDNIGHSESRLGSYVGAVRFAKNMRSRRRLTGSRKTIRHPVHHHGASAHCASDGKTCWWPRGWIVGYIGPRMTLDWKMAADFCCRRNDVWMADTTIPT